MYGLLAPASPSLFGEGGRGDGVQWQERKNDDCDDVAKKNDFSDHAQNFYLTERDKH